MTNQNDKEKRRYMEQTDSCQRWGYLEGWMTEGEGIKQKRNKHIYNTHVQTTVWQSKGNGDEGQVEVGKEREMEM